MANFIKLCSLTVILFCGFFHGNAEIVKGSKDTKDTWIFLARFCFLSKDGGFSYNISFPRAYLGQKLLLYYDEPHQWKAVYKNKSMTCEEKTSPPHINSENNQDITFELGLQYYWSGCEEDDDGDTINCESRRTFDSSRERWWYLALSNCGNEQGIKMDYNIIMTNGPDDEVFIHHFSADKLTMLEQHLAFLLLFLALCVCAVIVAVQLNKKDFLHTTFKMYMVSLFVKTFSLLILTCGYAVFARVQDGDPDKLYVTSCVGRIVNVMAYLIFLLMVILIGKGYTVTRGRLRLHTEILITVFMAVYTIAILLLYMVEFTLFDPGEVLYIYDFYFGIGLIILPILGFVWLIYAVIFTLKHYPEKWKFYVPFTILYSFWFLSLPVIVIASSYGIPVYMREKVVSGVELGISLVAYGVFLLLTLPCCTNLIFPFHVNTNKIDVMNNAPHVPASAGAYEVDGTSRPANAASSSNGRPPDAVTYTVTKERVTIHNVPQSQLGPNLAALFTVSNTRSEVTNPSDAPPQYGDIVKS